MENKKTIEKYQMNHVDRAYGLIDDSDDVNLSDELITAKLDILKEIELFWDMLEEEE